MAGGEWRVEKWLNYHHLQYFWMVAREGSVRRAAEELRVAPSTVSAQISQLQETLGLKLLRKAGRGLVLTEEGRAVRAYADAIFNLGDELLDFASGRQPGKPLHFDVGVTMVIPKLLAHKLLEPALAIAPDVLLRVREDTAERLLSELALHQLDVVLTDAPLGPSANVRAFDHQLGSCGVQLFATPALAALVADDFPAALEGAPVLMPTVDHLLRRQLDRWFHDRDLHPRLVAEFQDSALMKVFGQQGLGIFAAPDLIGSDIQRQYGVVPVGAVAGVQERYYALTVARRLRHPAVVALHEAALAWGERHG